MRHKLRQFLLLCLLIIAILAVVFSQIAPVSPIKITQFLSTKIYSREGKLLREIPSLKATYSEWKSLSEISDYLKLATISAEDKRFYYHLGIDPLATGHAVYQNLKGGQVVRGASTLSQQIVRRIEGLPRSWSAKFRVLAKALWWELYFSKNEVLEQYLNLVPYSKDLVGAEAAAQFYFSSPAKTLTLSQSAFLAVLPRSPIRLDPQKNLALVLKLREALLKKMLANKIISSDLYEQAMAEGIQLRIKPRYFLAPHFTQFIKVQLDAATKNAVNAEQKVHPTKVATTLNMDLQSQAEKIVQEHLKHVARYHIQNAAVVVIENSTGRILTWVGSQNYFDAEHSGQVDGVLAFRQPGSALKPFTYALALQQGFTPATILPDIKTYYYLESGEHYIPHNYNHDYHGPVRLREALAGSLNIPAVYLAKQVGPEKIYKTLREMAFPFDQPAWHYGLGITLGNAEVRLLDLANGYATLARGGKWRGIQWSDSEGQKQEKTIFPQRVTALVTDILSDEETRNRFFGLGHPFHFDFPAAVKTGTSSNWRDNWSIGYTQDVTVAVWVGNFNGEAMEGTSGATGAGPILRDLLEAAVKLYPRRQEILSKNGLVKKQVCTLSGKLSGPHCPHAVTELFLPEHVPEATCDYHREVNIDRRNQLLAGQDCLPQYLQKEVRVFFPQEFRAWAEDQGMHWNYSPLCPQRVDAVEISIAQPKNGARFLINPAIEARYQTIPLQVNSNHPGEVVEWYLDDKLYQKSAQVVRYSLERGKHKIVAQQKGVASEAVFFEVK